MSWANSLPKWIFLVGEALGSIEMKYFLGDVIMWCDTYGVRLGVEAKLAANCLTRLVEQSCGLVFYVETRLEIFSIEGSLFEGDRNRAMWCIRGCVVDWSGEKGV